jgi:pimeloyl-ACP methyl ester carboxylesterase
MDGRRPARCTLGALLVSAVAALAVAGSAHASPAFRPCEEAPKSPSRCTTVTVPLDRSGAVPGVVDLHVRTLAPTGTPTGAVLELAGGPGEAGSAYLDANARELGSVLAHRTLITFDQRGTGQSDRLLCVAFVVGYPLTEATTRCADELGPQRAFYTTSDSVADIESVRAALGIDKLILIGTSYGTKVAQWYAAEHPDHVERLVLESAVSTADDDPLQVSALQAIPGMLRTVCRGGACPFTPDPVADLAALVAKVRARPLHAVVHNFDGRPHAGRITEATVLWQVLLADVDPAVRASLPAALHSAMLGDGGPLLLGAAAQARSWRVI